MPLPSLRTRLKDGRPFIATFSVIPSVEVVEAIGLAGFDGVVLDMEHGAYGTETLGPLILAALARGIYPLVRVRSSEPTQIGAALDAGAAGVIVPQIGSVEEAMRAVRAARFAPEGHRGASPFVRAAGYSGRVEWFGEANAETAVLLMIEGANALREMEQIITTPGADGIFIGPMDLSHALGMPGQTSAPKVVLAIEGVIATCRRHGVTSGLFCGTSEAARRWIAGGVTFAGVGVDAGLLLNALKTIAADARRSPG